MNNISTAWRRAIKQLEICPEGFQIVVGKQVIGLWQREGLRGTDWSRRVLGSLLATEVAVNGKDLCTTRVSLDTNRGNE